MLTKTQLLAQATAVGPGTSFPVANKEHTDFLRAFQAGMVGGTSCRIDIEVSADNKHWTTLAEIYLGPGESDGTSAAVPWRFVRGNVIAVSGGGAIDATMTTWQP